MTLKAGKNAVTGKITSTFKYNYPLLSSIIVFMKLFFYDTTTKVCILTSNLVVQCLTTSLTNYLIMEIPLFNSSIKEIRGSQSQIYP